MNESAEELATLRSEKQAARRAYHAAFLEVRAAHRNYVIAMNAWRVARASVILLQAELVAARSNNEARPIIIEIKTKLIVARAATRGAIHDKRVALTRWQATRSARKTAKLAIKTAGDALRDFLEDT